MNTSSKIFTTNLVTLVPMNPCLFTDPLAALYKDVNVVHPSLLSCVEPLESQQVRELLRRLGVHELEPQELLEQHIYPSIRNNKWKVTMLCLLDQLNGRASYAHVFTSVFNFYVSLVFIFTSTPRLISQSQSQSW